jgi:heme/copper-type cytochrome/quinol oxidase subunit 2
MPIVVIAKPQAEFDAWLEGQQAAAGNTVAAAE